MKKVLNVVSVYFSIPFFFGNQINFFSEKGYDMHLICSPSGGKLKKFSNDKNCNYKEVEITRKVSIIKDVTAIYSVYKYIKRNKIDIVCGHTPKGALISMIASFLNRTHKRIYFRHGLVYETKKGISRFILIVIDRFTSLLATKIVCISPSVYKRSEDDNLNSKEKQILLAKGTCNGIDINRFNRNNISADITFSLLNKYRIQKNDFVIGFTGRLVRDKGIIELVDAFRIIKEEYPCTTLLLVGMFEDRDALPADTLKEILSNNKIVYTGLIENEDIENFYTLMDVFVLPSYREGFPTSVLEAASMELPVITTKATGCIDSIIENQTGTFINHNPTEIALAIIDYINDSKKRELYGKAGRKFVIENFEQKIIWNDIEKLYQN